MNGQLERHLAAGSRSQRLQATVSTFEAAQVREARAGLEAGHVAIGFGGGVFPEREPGQFGQRNTKAQSEIASRVSQHSETALLSVTDQSEEVRLLGVAG